MTDFANKNKRPIFISYAHEDKDFINDFAATLVHFDLQVWKDSKDIPIGGNILKNIYEGIKNTSHFCCIISKSSIQSAWVEEELSYAKVRQLEDRSLSIVPVLIDTVEIPDFLKAFRCAHFETRELLPNDSEFTMLLKAFGVEFKKDVPPLVTGSKRVELLAHCNHLQNELIEFRELISRFNSAYEMYENSSHSDGFSSFWIKQLREVASKLSKSIGLVRKSAENAQLLMGVYYGYIYDGLDQWETFGNALVQAAVICRVISEGKTNEEIEKQKYIWLNEFWWVNEKLQNWIQVLPRIEASVESVIRLLEHWGRIEAAD